jgi:alcohol dehydrogenase class IV
MSGGFSYAAPRMIRFGSGRFSEAADAVMGLLAARPASERRVIIVCGASGRFAGELESGLKDRGIESIRIGVPHEPDVPFIRSAVASARSFRPAAVVALGGGSAIDSAKAVAALAPNPGDVLEYLEVVGEGKPLPRDPLPCLAIPTTSGTGSEVTKNSVLSVREQRVKVSLRDPRMIPAEVIIDPALTLGLPPRITASTGMDALTQLIEPWVSPMATPVTDGFCREGILRAVRSLEVAFHRGDELSAREDMALASLFGGLALANAKLGAVHGFAGPMGGMYSAAHGSLCAALLPAVMEINLRVLEDEHSSDPAARAALLRFRQLGPLMTGEADSGASDALDFIRALVRRLEIPGLAGLGVDSSDFGTIIEKARASSSMKGNPVSLGEAELRQILEMSM